MIIFFSTLLWSFFPIVAIFVYKHISPLFTLILSNFFAVIFFSIIFILKNKFHELKNKKALKDIFFASISLLALWLFVFIGLNYTTAGNGSIFLLMEILFSFLYFGIWHKEKFTKSHITGTIIMAIGAIILLFPGEINFNKGDFLIILGTMFAPIGNFFQQKARKQVSTETMLLLRNIISIPIILIIALLFQQPLPTLTAIKTTLPLLIFSGTILFGVSKIMWIEGIHRIPVSKAVSVGVACPAFTLIFAYFFLNEIPTTWQITGFLPMLIGAILITRK